MLPTWDEVGAEAAYLDARDAGFAIQVAHQSYLEREAARYGRRAQFWAGVLMGTLFGIGSTLLALASMLP